MTEQRIAATMPRMIGHLEATASAIAVALVQGSTAEVVGEKWLKGVPLRYMEIDGVPVPTPDRLDAVLLVQHRSSLPAA